MLGIGSSNVLGIGIMVELRNKFSKEAIDIRRQFGGIEKDFNKMIMQNSAAMIGIGATTTASGIAITKSMDKAVSAAGKYQEKLLAIKAIGQLNDADMIPISKGILGFSKEFRYTQEEVAGAVEELVKAGVKSKDLLNTTRAILESGSASREAIDGESGVARRLTNIMMAWGIASGRATEMGDKITKAANISTISFNDIAESMSYGQDKFKNLNLTIEESLAMLGLLGNAGIKGSRAGIALANGWSEITNIVAGIKGNKTKIKALSMLGLSPQDLLQANGELLRPIQLIDKFRERVKGLTGPQREGILDVIFGKRGERAINPLIDFLKGDKTGMGSSLQSMIEQIKNSQGTNKRIIGELNKGYDYNKKLYENAKKGFSIAIGEALMPSATRLIKMLTALANKSADFARSGIGRVLVTILSVLGPILLIGGGLVTMIGLMGLGLKTSLIGWKNMGTTASYVLSMMKGKALEYLLAMRGVTAPGVQFAKNGAPYVINEFGMASFIKKGAGVAGAEASGTLGIMGSFGSVLSKVIPILSGLAITSSVLSLMGIDLSTQFGILRTIIAGIVEVIKSVLYLPLKLLTGYDITGGKSYWERMEDHSNFNNGQRSVTEIAQDNNSRQLPNRSPYDADMMRYITRGQRGTTETNTTLENNIYLDGQKIMSQRMEAASDNALNTYGY